MNLKEYLIANRTSVYQLASLTGVSPTTFARLLKGKKVSMRVAIKIEDGTNGDIKAQEIMKDGV